MDCPKCRDLERAFESGRSNYIAACSNPYYRVSTKLAAYKNVAMERAKSELEEHQLVCDCATIGANDPGDRLGHSSFKKDSQQRQFGNLLKIA